MITESMRQAIDETARRRELQRAYNEAHGITPETVRKEVRAGIEAEAAARTVAFTAAGQTDEGARRTAELLERLETEMMEAAAELDFERAAAIRDQMTGLRDGGTGARRGRSKRGQGGGDRSGRIPRPRRS